MGVTLVVALLYTVVNLLVDLIYARLDPRVRYG
jgi:peptide/nickel transport system permease protein